jgi:hypothetical protein
MNASHSASCVADTLLSAIVCSSVSVARPRCVVSTHSHAPRIGPRRGSRETNLTTAATSRCRISATAPTGRWPRPAAPSSTLQHQYQSAIDLTALAQASSNPSEPAPTAPGSSARSDSNPGKPGSSTSTPAPARRSDPDSPVPRPSRPHSDEPAARHAAVGFRADDQESDREDLGRLGRIRTRASRQRQEFDPRISPSAVKSYDSRR